jgi:glycosyltransferase involved in cell wall biosynthesis
MMLSVALPQAVVIHGEHERPRLYRMPHADRARVIPHFIEQRIPIPKDQARRLLGVKADAQIVGVLGWIHPRKDYELAIRLLSALGPRFELWLIGRPPGEDMTYLRSLQRLSRELGVAGRMTITGYVPDDDLALRLAALDVGLCPYHDASASGSMSTLLSARRPIIANDIAHATELAQLAPEAITVVNNADIRAYQHAIAKAAATTTPHTAFDPILTARSPTNIAAQYLTTLQAAAAT